MAGPKFQIRSRGWNIASVVGVVLLAVVGFGGLFLIRDSFDPDGTTMLWFLIILGIITTLLFAGPGIAYMARKRVAFLKRKLPGSSMGWIRSHLYLPILAVAAAFVHATVAPFRSGLSSGKVTFVVGVLVCIAGVSRHHMIGVQKEVLNLNLAITKRTQGQPRAFRNLVTDLTENRRPVSELDADAANMGESQQALWQEIRGLFERIEEHFPRAGGQRPHVRHYKLWKAVHAPLTAVLFVLLAYHVWDVLGGNQAFFGDEKTAFASSSECADCHTEIFQEWSTSSMAHAQTSTITEGQLPVTLSENRKLAGQLGPQQQEVFEQAAKVCINCHAPVGARFAENVDALLPFDEAQSAGAGGAGVAVSGGGAAVQEDGIGCITCHTQAAPAPERAGFGELAIDTGGASDYGVQFGPLFDDPKPVPVRVHGMENGDDGVWNDPLTSSRMCGSCHNVKADLDGDGVSPGNLPEDAFNDDKDSDGDFQLDQNELDRGDDKGLDDLTLQTTFDEWQDYVASFDQAFQGDDRQTLDGPLGCVECHMPSEGDGTKGVVDHAAGVLPVPERRHQSHSFVGVDYDLDPKQYQKEGMPENALETVLAERQALLQSAVTVEVANQPVQGDVLSADVTVRNNLLGHAFPTGFAFARQ
ncbi:MAG TPA: multiheme c-type cytochrome, partial [Acidimicrobiales bacterium]|nr:multiheme c-type cytochrome [Acidimicrobiales bacterium]